MNDTKTVSGAIVHVTDADEAPLVKCLVDIEPKQSGSGTPSPTNVRPISGWESVSVFDINKNLLPITMKTRTVNGITFTVEKDASGNVLSIAFSGTTTSTVTEVGLGITPPLKGGAYIINGCSNPNNTIRLQLKKKGEAAAIAQQFNNNDVSFTAIDGTEYVVTICIVGNGMAVNATIYPMIRLASDTDATFEPYNGHTTTTSLGRTVYGGTLDVVTGVLKVDRAMVTINGSSNFTQRRAGTSNSLFGLDLASGQGGKAVAETALPNVIANELPLETAYNAWRNEAPLVAVTSTGNTIWFRLPSITALADAKTYLASNPLQVCYELATPQTYTLTEQEISTLLGDNNVWADCGDVEITYHTDTLGIYNKIYIDGRPYFRPNNFEIKREDVYAGEYTTCTGKLIADKIGWKYSDLPMKWDILPDEDLVYLTTLTGAFNLIFRDSDGQHTEQVIRRGFANTPTRITGPNGTKIWTGLEMEISFLNTHPIGE